MPTAGCSEKACNQHESATAQPSILVLIRCSYTSLYVPRTVFGRALVLIVQRACFFPVSRGAEPLQPQAHFVFQRFGEAQRLQSSSTRNLRVGFKIGEGLELGAESRRYRWGHVQLQFASRKNNTSPPTDQHSVTSMAQDFINELCVTVRHDDDAVSRAIRMSRRPRAITLAVNHAACSVHFDSRCIAQESMQLGSAQNSQRSQAVPTFPRGKLFT